MWKILATALVLLEAYHYVSGAKILMKSNQLGSNILVQVSLGKELASRGHDVYIAVASRYPKQANIEKSGIKILTYKYPDGVMYGISEEFEKMVAEVIFSENENKLAASGREATKICNDDCTYMMEDKNFLENARKLNFDLVIVEWFLFGQCNLILPKYLGIPFVTNAAVYLPWHIRIPALPSFTNMLTPWTDLKDVTLTSRLSNLFTYVTIDFMLSRFGAYDKTLLELYAPKYKSWNELLRQSELFLAGCDHHFGGSFPEMPNYISVAGINADEPKKLPKDLEDVVEKSTETILLSFGSNAYYFPKEVIVKFLEAFSKLNQTVIVKFFIPDGVKVPQNVLVSSWLPQNDILGHPKTKLFITHCGMNGIYEALYNGVPMIGFPLFAEQHSNAQRIYKKGFGLQMKVQDFTSDELFQNIQEVLNNPKYRSTIKKASEVFRDQPMNARQRGAFWVEHVIKHEGKHLRGLAMDLPLYQFFMVDVLLVIVFVVVAFLFLIRSFCRCLCKRATQSKVKTN